MFGIVKRLNEDTKLLPEGSDSSYNNIHKKHKEFISRINASVEYNETKSNIATQHYERYFREGEGRNNGNSRENRD